MNFELTRNIPKKKICVSKRTKCWYNRVEFEFSIVELLNLLVVNVGRGSVPI